MYRALDPVYMLIRLRGPGYRVELADGDGVVRAEVDKTIHVSRRTAAAGPGPEH